VLPRFDGKEDNEIKNTVRAERVIFLNPQIGGENFSRKSTRESPRSPFFSLSHLLHFLLESKMLIDFSSLCLSLPLRHPLFPSQEQSLNLDVPYITRFFYFYPLRYLSKSSFIILIFYDRVSNFGHYWQWYLKFSTGTCMMHGVFLVL
jgi:hypothetical protein